jgi:hypothetical protein
MKREQKEPNSAKKMHMLICGARGIEMHFIYLGLSRDSETEEFHNPAACSHPRQES